MELLNKFRKAGKIRNAIGFILVGLFMAVLSVIIIGSPNTEYLTATATIVDIQEEYDITLEEYTHNVFIDYSVNGVDYKNVPYVGYDSSMEIGRSVEIEYDPANPENIQTPGGGFIPYVTLAAGLACIVLGVISMVKSIKQKSSDMNEYNRVDMSKVSEDEIEEIKSNSEPENSYVFHFDGKVKAGYEMEDSEHRMIYEARMTEFSVAKPFTFEFTNHYSHTVKTMKIGHTVSQSIGVGDGMFSSAIPISSSFKIDGVSNWDYLASNGYGFDLHLKGITPCFDVMHYGVKVAYIETAGTEVFKEDSKNPIRKLPVNGIYRVSCKASDLDMVFMTCFSIARAIFYEN